MLNLAETVARSLVEIGAVGFCMDKPITFKSGMLSPVYVDNRTFPYHPNAWQTVIEGFKSLITVEELRFEVVAGIEAAGIPHSATLGYVLQAPSVFCRKQTKDHGTKKLVEGGEVKGKRVLLIEDLVTTGSSSLVGVEALRSSGATVKDCLVIVSYGFKEAKQAFAEAEVELHALTSFPVVLEQAEALKRINFKEKEMVMEWLADPWGWTKQHGAGAKV